MGRIKKEGRGGEIREWEERRVKKQEKKRKEGEEQGLRKRVC